MAYFGAGLVFSTVAVLAWLGRREYSAVWITPIGVGLVSVFAGILLGLTNGCGGSKK